MPIYAAGEVVLRRARKLLPGRVLEVEVQKAMQAGHARLDRQGAMVEAPDFLARLGPARSSTNPQRRVWMIMWIGAPPE
jgi:hypothetical protein